MWPKKNKEKEKQEKNIVRASHTRHITETSQTVTFRTIEQRSQSVSYFNTSRGTTNITPSSSLSNIDTNKLSPGFTSQLKSSSSSNLGNSKSLFDAKPLTITPTPINLNYQSPYARSSPVYRSYKPSARPVTVLPPVIPSTVQPKPCSQHSNKKLIVKKTGKFYDVNTTVPTYQTHSKNRGEVLIINNIMFKDKGYRHGAKVDDESLKELFKQIGFKVNLERDLKSSAMEKTIKNFSEKSSLKTADMAVVVVMSHGTKNQVLGGTEVFGLDEKGIPVDDLLDYFNEEKCKYMKGKPKIFIFQCCRGDNEQFVQSDATRVSSKTAVLADALIAYSTLPGFVSHRDPITGTWYISTLCDVFSQHAHEYHVEDLLKVVDVQLSAMASNVRQTTHYENRGFKRCYLHPA